MNEYDKREDNATFACFTRAHTPRPTCALNVFGTLAMQRKLVVSRAKRDDGAGMPQTSK